jgi:hypothetical protein
LVELSLHAQARSDPQPQAPAHRGLRPEIAILDAKWVGDPDAAEDLWSDVGCTRMTERETKENPCSSDWRQLVAARDRAPLAIHCRATRGGEAHARCCISVDFVFNWLGADGAPRRRDIARERSPDDWTQ